jgi:cell division protein FtsB
MDENKYKKSIEEVIGDENLFNQQLKGRILNEIREKKQRSGVVSLLHKLTPVFIALFLLLGGGAFFYLTFNTPGKHDAEINTTKLADYEAQIAELKKENERLQGEFQELNSDYSVYLQQTDGTSRRIMRLISENKFEQLKSEYGIEFEVTDGHLIFPKLDEFNPGFPIAQANFPMFVAYFNIQSDFIEIGYYLDDLQTDERYSITFSYDKDGNFEYIYVGDV